MRQQPPPRRTPPRSTPASGPHAAPPGGSLPLWQLLTGCAEAVAAVREGRSLTDVLAGQPAAQRPGAQAL